ncbi:MAG: cytochrome c biogenesis heme-transporting ATPase CcmA [Betaproteobacteria bacterium]|nr:cytochrome c biogenesis heme-transporting ATPase CcmA [Betaproteobacteria bacterium]
MLDASALECVRGERTLFRDVSFALEGGSLLRIAGANGSGKTSLLRILCGLSPPAQGEVRWRGERIRALGEEYWRHLIYIGHANAVKDDLTALENLEIATAIGGRTATDGAALDALGQFGVAPCAALPARVLSQGQRRRVALARLALSAEVPLWVLDEPFTALDTAAVRFMESLIGGQLARGGTVVFTTHQEVTIVAAISLRIDLSA